MPDLLAGPSAKRIEYTLSLPHSLLSTISLVCAAPKFEGLADWLREARLRLAPELLSELCLLVTFPGSYHRFTAELLACLPDAGVALGFDELMEHLETMPGSEVQEVALRALARGATPGQEPSELVALSERPDEWAAYLTSVESEAEPEAVASLVRDGEVLRQRLTAALRRFWWELYAGEFEATRPLMERSVAHHQAQHYSANFHELFFAITGRLVPEKVAKVLPSVSTVLFIPSCYVGPYVAYTHYDGHVVLFFNCRATPAGPATVDGAMLYPPLKALADETRLQILALLSGRELYAQEIVEKLDISQPAVSRHLNLMAAAGVLETRREGNAKYYSVRLETLSQLAKALQAMVR
jgi:hypothetical protein